MDRGRRSLDIQALRLNRRGFVRTTTAGVGGGLLSEGANAAALNLEAYASATSVAIGGTLKFHARDPGAVGASSASVPVTIVRVGFPDVAVLTSSVKVGRQVVPTDAVTRGCRWPVSYSLTVPNTWPSGLYYAAFGRGANACAVPFVVRAVRCTPKVSVLVVIPASTVQAYNAYGGKSLYDFNSTGGVRAAQVSFDRPFTEPFNTFFDVWSQVLVRWLAKNKIAADFCTDIDVHADAALLDPYQLCANAGHHEYWTLAMRQHVDAFVARGGNLAILGGNTCWFQSRLESGNAVANRTLVCYKNAATDPNPTPALKTVNWTSLSPINPENSTTGLSFLKGASWVSATIPRPNTPFKAARPDHWVFAGAGLPNTGLFGGTIVGYECDGIDFVLGAVDHRPHPTGLDRSAPTTRILAQADASDWNAKSLAAGGTGELSGIVSMVIFSRGGTQGTVFNAATTDWAYGLRPELDGAKPTPISRITLNVFKRLQSPWHESADIRRYRLLPTATPSHFYFSLTPPVLSGINTALDGVAFKGFAASGPGTVPVYRHRSDKAGASGWRYRLSLRCHLDADDDGGASGGHDIDDDWGNTGVAFHAYAHARSDAVAVHEHVAWSANRKELRALYSLDAVPPAGWAAGPIVFYVPSE